MSRQRVFINGKKFYQHPIFCNYAAPKDGEVVNTKGGKILKMIKSNGYCRFDLVRPKKYFQHGFIWEVIKGVIPEGFEIDDINNCKTDNRIEKSTIINTSEKC